MASNYTPLDALNFAKRFVMNMPLDDATIKIPILQAASDELHLYAPWRWTIGEFTKETIVEDQEDYTIDAVTDALYGLGGELRFVEKTRTEPLKFVAKLTASGVHKGTPRQVYWDGVTTLRLHPIPGGMDASDLPKLITWYKLINIRIQESGSETALVKNDDNAAALRFGDEWFWVYRQLVLKHAYQFTSDPRLGSMQVDSRGGVALTGQMAVCEHLLRQMREKEKPLLFDIGEEVA